MDVSEIITLLARLSIGLDKPDDEETVIYLQFINLAYFELLMATLNQSPTVVKLNERLDCTNGILSNTSQEIFIPKGVYDIKTNRPLLGTSEEDVLKNDPALVKTGSPQTWYYANGVLNTYPLSTSLVIKGGGIGVRYIAKPPLLTALSQSADILIPSMYHQILVDGASYYVFQSEPGFKGENQMMSARVKWEDGKKKLFSYMENISGKKHLSTFSYV